MIVRDFSLSLMSLSINEVKSLSLNRDTLPNNLYFTLYFLTNLLIEPCNCRKSYISCQSNFQRKGQNVEFFVIYYLNCRNTFHSIDLSLKCTQEIIKLQYLNNPHRGEAVLSFSAWSEASFLFG
jgi:hypothetical protein